MIRYLQSASVESRRGRGREQQEVQGRAVGKFPTQHGSLPAFPFVSVSVSSCVRLFSNQLEFFSCESFCQSSHYAKNSQDSCCPDGSCASRFHTSRYALANDQAAAICVDAWCTTRPLS